MSGTSSSNGGNQSARSQSDPWGGGMRQLQGLGMAGGLDPHQTRGVQPAWGGTQAQPMSFGQQSPGQQSFQQSPGAFQQGQDFQQNSSRQFSGGVPPGFPQSAPDGIPPPNSMGGVPSGWGMSGMPPEARQAVDYALSMAGPRTPSGANSIGGIPAGARQAIEHALSLAGQDPGVQQQFAPRPPDAFAQQYQADRDYQLAVGQAGGVPTGPAGAVGGAIPLEAQRAISMAMQQPGVQQAPGVPQQPLPLAGMFQNPLFAGMFPPGGRVNWQAPPGIPAGAVNAANYAPKNWNQ